MLSFNFLMELLEGYSNKISGGKDETKKSILTFMLFLVNLEINFNNKILLVLLMVLGTKQHKLLQHLLQKQNKFI